MKVRVVAGLAVLLTWFLLGASPASAAEGVALLDPDSNRPLASGGSTSPFTIGLPDGAACPGDSVDGQYRVQSFLVPVPTDPATLRYTLQPEVEQGKPLYQLDTRRYINAATARATTKGGPGLVVGIPALSFGVFEPDDIRPGRYHVGIACTLFGATERHWSTEIDIVSDPEDEPAGLRWRVVTPTITTGEDAGVAPVVVAAVVLAGGSVVLGRRRRQVARTVGSTS